ncbi:MAG: hypothetical protein RL722_2887 [Pseudomonadota bacterium]|jgi:hypothetical protein
MSGRIFRLHDPTSHLRCSPYGCTAALLAAISGRSPRKLQPPHFVVSPT